MNLSPLPAALACCLVLAGCVSPVERRIEKNPALFQALSARHQALVRQGRVEEGMTAPAVWLAWGRPDRVAAGSRQGRAFERWSYTGYEPVHTSAFGFGFAGGCYYDSWFYAEPMVQYIPYEARRVEFSGGKVSAWAAGR